MSAAPPTLRQPIGWLRRKLARASVHLRRGQIVRDFNNLYYYSGRRTWQSLHWRGVPCLKCPTDLWAYQEILATTQPEVIVECGVCYGGTTLFLADLCQIMGRGEVIGIDVDLERVSPVVRDHPRVHLLEGDSAAEATRAGVEARCRSRRTMVVLDSDHHEEHVRLELAAYAPLVSPGCYLIVEDTIIAGHPAWPDWPDGGPYAAAAEFLGRNPQFEADAHPDRLMLTFNPRGYLRRRA